jgi:hypothetical protein
MIISFLSIDIDALTGKDGNFAILARVPGLLSTANCSLWLSMAARPPAPTE